MRPLEPGCKALVVHGSRSGKIPIGTVVDVLRTCSCWSNKPEKGLCGGCGRRVRTVWVVEVPHLGEKYCACECALMRIDPDPRQAWRFHVERKRDEMEDPELTFGRQLVRRELDELLDDLEQESLE